jgi:hypothetical protein
MHQGILTIEHKNLVQGSSFSLRALAGERESWSFGRLVVKAHAIAASMPRRRKGFVL